MKESKFRTGDLVKMAVGSDFRYGKVASVNPSSTYGIKVDWNDGGGGYDYFTADGRWVNCLAPCLSLDDPSHPPMPPEIKLSNEWSSFWLEPLDPLKSRLKLMKEYLQDRVDREDWHGVADAAADIRELVVELRVRQELA